MSTDAAWWRSECQVTSSPAAVDAYFMSRAARLRAQASPSRWKTRSHSPVPYSSSCAARAAAA